MKPEEKANELIEKFQDMGIVVYGCSDEFGQNPCIIKNAMLNQSAKQCALICVDEIIEIIDLSGNNFNWSYADPKIQTPKEYWKEVKSIIENE